MRRASRGAALLCAALLLPASARAQDDALAALNDALSRARYGEALERTEELADPALAAEWRSYLRSLAGDLPGALREALAGLQHAPQHTGLLTQALNASLTLGLADRASELSQRLLDAAADDPALAERAAELAGWARDLVERERLAQRSVARSRTVALAGIALALVALAWMARSAPRDGA